MDAKSVDCRLITKRLEKFFKAHRRVYAYGAGRYGRNVVRFLEALGLRVDSVLVTDAAANPKVCEGVRVQQADEVICPGDGILLALAEKYRRDVIPALEGAGADVLAFSDDVLRQMDGWAWDLRHASAIRSAWPHHHRDGHLRVAIFSHCTGLMGASRSLLDNLSVWQKRATFHPLVITPDAGDLNEALERMGIPSLVAAFDWWAHVPPKKARDNAQVVEELTDVLSELGVDLCYSNGSVIDIGARVAAKLQVPHVWHIREYATEDYGQVFDIGNDEAKRVIARTSAAVIFISKALAKKYMAVTGSSENYHLIYNGVSLRHAPQKKRADFHRTPISVVMVGGVNAAKNQQELIEALALLTGEEREQFALHFYGPEEKDYRARLDARIAQEHLDGKVTFHGYTSEIGRALAGCEIAVMASRAEAFGRVTVEYMMSGLFVIASDTGANPELLRDGKDGLLYPAGQPEALAERLRWCLAHRSEMAETALRNQGEPTAKRFSPQRTADAVYQVFEDAVAGDPS